MSKLSGLIWLIAVIGVTYLGFKDPRIGFIGGFFLSLLVGLAAVLAVQFVLFVIKWVFRALFGRRPETVEG